VIHFPTVSIHLINLKTTTQPIMSRHRYPPYNSPAAPQAFYHHPAPQQRHPAASPAASPMALRHPQYHPHHQYYQNQANYAHQLALNAATTAATNAAAATGGTAAAVASVNPLRYFDDGIQ